MNTRFGRLIVIGILAGCGSYSSKSSSSPPQPDAPWQVPITNLKDTHYSVKALKQAYADATELADLTETMTTGLDDRSGALSTPRPPSPQFTFAVDIAVDFNAVTQPFVTEATFYSLSSASGSVDGNAKFHGAPKVAFVASQGNVQVLELKPTFSLKRTSNANEVISVYAEGNLTITKSGRRQDGKVERVLRGDVHRVLTSPTDSNVSFDYHFTYKDLKVSDAYTAGRLTSRTLEGEVAIVGGYSVQFHETNRSDVALCLCPTSGSATGSFPHGDEGDEAITFSFGNACGETAAKRTYANIFTGPPINATLLLQGCAITAANP